MLILFLPAAISHYGEIFSSISIWDDAKPQNNVEPEVVAKRVPLGTLDVDNTYDPQHVKGDDESLLANNVPPTYIHDKNNPRIEVGATFPDSQAFKVALRQVAIREDWSFDTEYSEPERFRAKCKDKDCPWRIHASKIKNTKTNRENRSTQR